MDTNKETSTIFATNIKKEEIKVDENNLVDLVYDIVGKRVERESLYTAANWLNYQAKALDDEITNIKNKIVDYMKKTGQVEMKVGSHVISVRDNYSVEVTCNTNELPPAYIRTKMEPNRLAIRDAIQNGKIITGCSLNNSKSLTVN